MSDAEFQITRPVTVPAGRGAAWLFEGFTMFQKDWAAWIGVTVIFFVLSIAANLVPLGGFLFNLVIFVFAGGLMLGCREIDRGGEFTVSHLFAGFSDNLGQYILLGVIYSVGTVVIFILTLILMFVMLGGFSFIADIQSGQFDKLLQYSATILIVILVALLLSLPLIMAFWFAPALVALGRLEAIEAIKQSYSGCMVNVVSFLAYGIVGLIISVFVVILPILGFVILPPIIGKVLSTLVLIFLLGIGLLLLFSMTIASIYISYRDIFESGTSEPLTTNH